MSTSLACALQWPPRMWKWLPIALLLAWGCTGTIGDGDEAPVPSAEELGVGPTGVRRLTVYEYDNMLVDLLQDDTRPALNMLPEDKSAPFDNDFLAQWPSAVLVESCETLAADIATRLLADAPRRDAIVGCTADDAACLTSFVERFGRRAFRRPLTPEEVQSFVTLGSEYATSDFYAGVEVVLRAFLQSAAFLYRIELGTPVDGQPGLYRLNDYEIGTRMAFLLWGSAPDDALLDAARDGRLSLAEGRREAALRMLGDERARRQIDRFHAQWLAYEKMPLSADLTMRMRAETAALLTRVIFEEQASWLDIFQATETFVDDTLAQHYGFPPGASGWVDTARTGRQGILSHGSFLSAASNPADTSPTKRGVLVRERLLCETIGPPDPDAPADMPPDPTFGNCKWDQYAASRATSAKCTGCHEQLDLLGFGLENYDMQGRYRTHDDNKPECPIDYDGEIVGVGKFRGPAELSDLLIAGGQLGDCAVQHLLQFTIGREVSSEDAALVSSLRKDFEASAHRFHALMLAVVAHEAFAYRLEMEVTP